MIVNIHNQTAYREFLWCCTCPMSHYVHIHVFSQGLWQFRVLPSAWPPWPTHLCKSTQTTIYGRNNEYNSDLSEKQLCSKVPFGVNCNSVFLVDLLKLGTSRDIVCDDMGSWKWGGSYRMWLSVDEVGDVFVRGKLKPSTLDPKLSYYRVWKRYYENKSSPDLKKIIVTLEGIRCMYTPYIIIVSRLNL